VENSRRLPSFRVRCALAAGLFALGIVLGAAIGPAPQSSLAGPTAPAQKLIASLLARSAGTSATAGTPTTKASPSNASPSSAPSSNSAARSSATTPLPASASPAPTSAGNPAAAIPTTPTSGPSETKPAGSPSGTSTPVASGHSTTPLPAISHVWLIVLPGGGFASAQAQSGSDPYLSRQLLGEGTLLKSYSPLEGSTLSADAALLSGQSTPQQSSYTAPGCNAAAQPACTPGSAGELAGVDAYLHQLIPRITASADYREHGLIAIAFSASGESANTPAPAGASPAAEPTTLATQPLGVLLLSPFLRKRGTQSTTHFHPATPRKDLEGLLRG
jgi:hypothetical protein